MSKPERGPDLPSEKSPLDRVDAAILRNLHEQPRLSMRQLAPLIGLSAPSVAERVRKLEEAGIIRGYGIEIDSQALGHTITALSRIRPLAGQLHRVEAMIRQCPEIIECDRMTGDDPFLARLAVRSVAHLDAVLATFADYAVTSTTIVKARTVERRLPPL
jgi:Lrp/AsnC family leucine-responsive transcriptional regulator